MFIPPERFDLAVSEYGSPQYWADHALARLRPAFNPQKPTALFIGRYQPFHAGHQRLIEEGLRRVGQVCIAVRDTHGLDEKNPLPFFAVKQRIEAALSAYDGSFVVIPLPNITNVSYGRDVGPNRTSSSRVSSKLRLNSSSRRASKPAPPANIVDKDGREIGRFALDVFDQLLQPIATLQA